MKADTQNPDTEDIVAICHKPRKMGCEFKDGVEYEDKTVCEYFYAGK